MLEELFVYCEETTLTPTAEERYELILELDAQSNGIVDEADFYNLEEKCFGNALKVLRAKKNKFSRYLAASLVVGGGAHRGSIDTTHNHLMRSSTFFGSVVSPFMSRQPTLQGGVDNLDVINNKDLLFQRAVSEASVYGNIHNAHIIDRYRSTEANHQLDIAANSEKMTWWANISAWGSKIYTYCSLIAMQIDTVSFDICVDSIMFVIGLVFITHTNIDGVFYAYLTLSLFECCLKLYVKGRFRYVKSYRNGVDGVMTLLLLIVCIERNANHLHSDYRDDFGIKALILIRSFMYPRNIICTQYFKTFRERHRLAFEHAFRGAGHFSFLLLVMFAFMYGFACLGQQIFGGVIVKTGDNGAAISGTEYGLNEYWPLNFNDIPSGFVTMFVLLHVNNMHVTASGFTVIKGEWCELFFAAW